MVDNNEDGMARLRAKIVTVIERVGVTDMTAQIVIDLVAAALNDGSIKTVTSATERVLAGTKTVKSRKKRTIIDVDAGWGGKGGLASPVLLLSPPESPDLSKQNLPGSEYIMGEPRVAPGKQVSPFWKALRCFCEIWRTKYGVWYEATPADKNQLGRLISSIQPGLLRYLPMAFNAYLADLTPFVAQGQRHSLRYFCSCGGFNKYRVQVPAISEREARSLEAARQFVEEEDSWSNGHQR